MRAVSAGKTRSYYCAAAQCLNRSDMTYTAYGANSGLSSNSFIGSADAGQEPIARCNFHAAGSKIIDCTVSRPMFTWSIFVATSAMPS